MYISFGQRSAPRATSPLHGRADRGGQLDLFRPAVVRMGVSRHLGVLLQQLHAVEFLPALALKLDTHAVVGAEVAAQVGGGSTALPTDRAVVRIPAGV